MDYATNQFTDDAYYILQDDCGLVTSNATDTNSSEYIPGSSAVILSQVPSTVLMDDDDVIVSEIITEGCDIVTNQSVSPSEIVQVIPSNYVTLPANLDSTPDNILDYQNVPSNGLIAQGDVILVHNSDDIHKTEDVPLCFTEEKVDLDCDMNCDNDQSSDSFQDLVIDLNDPVDDRRLLELECSKCFLNFPNANALKRHYRMFHKKSVKKSKKNKSKTAPKVINTAEPSDRDYCCPACTYTTRFRDEMDKHVQGHVDNGYHPNGKKRNCPNQPVQRQHHTAEEYQCEDCPYVCTVEEALIKHQKLHCTTKEFVLKLSCKICGKDRRSDLELKKHMRKHIDGQKFICDLCGFRSVQMKKIIQHRRMHTGERPHLCPFCNYRAARRDNLRSHVRRVHKKENMYSNTFNPADLNDESRDESKTVLNNEI